MRKDTNQIWTMEDEDDLIIVQHDSGTISIFNRDPKDEFTIRLTPAHIPSLIEAIVKLNKFCTEQQGTSALAKLEMAMQAMMAEHVDKFMPEIPDDDEEEWIVGIVKESTAETEDPAEPVKGE